MNRTEVLFSTFKWVDYLNPDRALLEQLAVELELPPQVVLNCMDSDHLPHVETYGEKHFFIIRLMEPKTKLTADSVQELTTKIALFLVPGKMVTVHRLALNEVEVVGAKARHHELTRPELVSYFFEQVALGFDQPLTDLENTMSAFEEKMFQRRRSRNFLQEGFYIKRKASAFKKVLTMTLDLISKLIIKSECSTELFQESRDRLGRSLFYAEDVHETIQSLLNLHVAIESQRTNEASFKTNEIMRVLTVLTIFFLPLNFLTGLFGMNFREMPLLESPAGFWISVMVMILLSATLALYLFRQGWLERPEIKIDSKSAKT